jgi:glycosyltransferase involved in cell wall biosynthesis
MKDSKPYFSIVIPMYNRARFIARALNSCLSQDFTDFEIVVVDDGSTDGSADVVRCFTDGRIRLVCHEMNRGVSPARNTGVAAASGEWVIYLDSDDELLPGALATIYRRTSGVSSDVGKVCFMGRLDSGKLSPQPPLKDEIWDYEGYFRWAETIINGKSDALPCVRRTTFQNVHWPNDRRTIGIYHADLARLFLTRSCTDVVALFHSDAGNQITNPSATWELLCAPNRAKGGEEYLARHGKALSKWAPTLFLGNHSSLAVQYFLCGQRLKGLRYALRCIQHNPASPKFYAVMAFGLLGPRAFASIQAVKRSFVKARSWNHSRGLVGALSRTFVDSFQLAFTRNGYDMTQPIVKTEVNTPPPEGR